MLGLWPPGFTTSWGRLELISATKNWHCATTHNGDLILRNIGLLLVGGVKPVLFSLNSWNNPSHWRFLHHFSRWAQPAPPSRLASWWYGAKPLMDWYGGNSWPRTDLVIYLVYQTKPKINPEKTWFKYLEYTCLVLIKTLSNIIQT